MIWAPGIRSTLELRRWERMLRAEHSATFELASLVSRVPGIRRIVGCPARLDARDARSLAAREARVAAVRTSLIGRIALIGWLWQPFGRVLRKRSDAEPKPMRPAYFPRVGPLLDREIDAALELLGSVPFEELQWRGWHLQPNHFHTPLNDLRFLRKHPELWLREKIPAEVDWDVDGQLRLLERLAAYLGDLDDVPETPPGEPGRFGWNNESLPRGDVAVYYGILRELRPRRVIEVGAGWSSLILARALAANDQACEVTLIDPELRRDILGELPAAWRLVNDPVQLADPAPFDALEAGDVLFYDGSHCVRTASDVNWMFFEILPRLAPGVWIHAHDLLWPSDYPPTWLLDDGLSWNEQYLVQAFLAGNVAYRVRLAVSMLSALRRDELDALLPKEFEHGGSLWIEKTSRLSYPNGP